MSRTKRNARDPRSTGCLPASFAPAAGLRHRTGRLPYLALFLLLFLAACGGEGDGQEGQVTVVSRPTATGALQQVDATPTSQPMATPAPVETEPGRQTEPMATPAPVETEPGPETEPMATPAPPQEEPTATPPSAPLPRPLQTIRLEAVLQGLNSPTYLTHAADDRLFITEQDGLIRVVIDGQTAQQPFLDITDRVGFNANEQGLLGLAFHPDYAENGYFFVDYTDGNGNTIVSRFQVSTDPNVADPSSEQVVLAVQQPFGNHNGGQILFGPDGYLYVGLGDGGSGGDPQGNGQNPDTLLGSILRLDVDNVSVESPYAIPNDNPFAGGQGAPEVWAYGLRNPWRFSFDPQLDTLFVADVGQNQYEEINALPLVEAAGANYGWNTMEGLHCYSGANCDQSGLVLPVVEYSHEQGGCSVTGGYVYRGAQYEALAGHYFFGDYCSGFIWSLYQNEEGRWTTGQGALVTVDGQITSFGTDAQGEIYVVTREGVIYHLQP